MAYWVYVLRSETTGGCYVGATGDLVARLARHNAGRAPATRGRGPWRLIHQEVFPTRQAAQAALARERALKAQKSRPYLERLCAASPGG